MALKELEKRKKLRLKMYKRLIFGGFEWPLSDPFFDLLRPKLWKLLGYITQSLKKNMPLFRKNLPNYERELTSLTSCFLP